eukprot:6409562-Heterocapsa_arctica.AAC.1
MLRHLSYRSCCSASDCSDHRFVYLRASVAHPSARSSRRFGKTTLTTGGRDCISNTDRCPAWRAG